MWRADNLELKLRYLSLLSSFSLFPTLRRRSVRLIHASPLERPSFTPSKLANLMRESFAHLFCSQPISIHEIDVRMEPESDSLTDIYDRAVERYTKLTASLPPLQTLILRSIALAAVVVTSFAAVCICWSSMYKAIVPKEGRVGQVWLQYG